MNASTGPGPGPSLARTRRGYSKDAKDKNLNLVDVYDIAADIGKVNGK